MAANSARRQILSLIKKLLKNHIQGLILNKHYKLNGSPRNIVSYCFISVLNSRAKTWYSIVVFWIWIVDIFYQVYYEKRILLGNRKDDMIVTKSFHENCAYCYENRTYFYSKWMTSTVLILFLIFRMIGWINIPWRNLMD